MAGRLGVVLACPRARIISIIIIDDDTITTAATAAADTAKRKIQRCETSSLPRSI